MRIFLTLCFSIITYHISAQSIITKFEQTNGRQTPTYHEIITWWKMLDAKAGQVKMFTMGPGDAGYPLHLVMVSTDNDFDPANLHKKKTNALFLLITGFIRANPMG